MSVVLR